jgi:hypothetical protein
LAGGDVHERSKLGAAYGKIVILINGVPPQSLVKPDLLCDFSANSHGTRKVGSWPCISTWLGTRLHDSYSFTAAYLSRRCTVSQETSRHHHYVRVLRHEFATVPKIMGMKFDIVIKKGNQVAIRMNAIKSCITLTT